MNAPQPQDCPLCGEGRVTDCVEYVEQEYKNHKAMLPLHYCLCDHCASDFAGAAQAKLNKRALIAFRKKVDGLLTGPEIVALRGQYQLTQLQAANLFGGGPVAFCKYENDDVAQSEAMDALLRLVRRSPEIFWALVEEKQMSHEFVRTQKVVAPSGSVLVFRSVSGDANLSNAYYDPKEFRHFEVEGNSRCQK